MKRNVSLITAVSIVVTNMIGIGILTTPGVISSYLTTTGQVMSVWILGGLIALLGAVVYGQMGSLMPHSGGEFHYLSRIYHPVLGMAAGWVSVIAGFAGPIALSTLAFAKYSLNITHINQLFSDSVTIDFREKIIGLLLIIFISLFHILRKRTALNFQLIITGVLISFLFVICYLGLNYKDGTIDSISFFSETVPNYGMALLLSIYSYTGWNASCYFSGEIKNPKKNLPLSLFLGVLLVMGLYLAVNYGLMNVLGGRHLNGRVDFLSELGTKVAGIPGSQIIPVTVLVILVASISSMIFTGSRIPLFEKNRNKSRHIEPGVKQIAKMQLLQTGIAGFFILFTSFQQLLLLLTLILSFFSILTAFGIFLLPWKRLKTSKAHELIVKFSALVMLLVFIWLIANGISDTVTIQFFILIAVPFIMCMAIFLIFRNRNKVMLQKQKINSIYNPKTQTT
jgi:APA family basic amino acid/polyamine antiporter